MSALRTEEAQVSPEKEPTNIFELALLFPHYIRSISDFSHEKEVVSQEKKDSSSCHAWAGTDKKTGKRVIVKEIVQCTLRREMQRFFREVVSIATLNNKFVVQLVGFTVEEPFSVITEYSPDGTLYQLIHAKQELNPFSPTHKTIVALIIAFAMNHVHDHNIIHRGLCSNSILIGKNGFPVISKFSLSRFDNERCKTSRIGYVSYIAPECLKDLNYSSKADVYSFGILLYEMSENSKPYPNKRKEDIFDELINGDIRPEFSRNTSRELQKYISKCWTCEIDERPTFAQIFEDFASGKIAFPSADRSKVKVIAEKLKRSLGKERKEKKMPPVYVNLQNIYSKLQQKTNTINSTSKEINANNNKNKPNTDNNLTNNNNMNNNNMNNNATNANNANNNINSPTEIKPIAKINMAEIIKSTMNQTSTLSNLYNGTAAIIPSGQNNSNIDNKSSNDKDSDLLVKNPINEPTKIENNWNESKGDSTIETFDKIVYDVLNPKLLSYIDSISETLKPSQYKEYISMADRLIQKNNENLMLNIMKNIFKIGRRDINFIDLCMEKDIIKKLPINTINFLTAISDIYSFFFIQKKNYLKDQDILSNIHFLVKSIPDEMVNLFSIYVKELPPLDQSLPLIDIFHTEIQIFRNLHCSINLLSVFHYLSITNIEYLQKRKIEILNAASLLSASTEINVVQHAYNVLISLYDPVFHLDFDNIISQFGNDLLNDQICSLLLRVTRFPSSRRLGQYFTKKAKTSEKWGLVLLNFASCKSDTATIIAKSNEWMTEGIPNFEYNFKLFLILFSFSDVRPIVVSHTSFFYLLLLFLEIKNEKRNFVLSSFGSIFKRIPNISIELLNSLQEGKFFSRYYMAVYEEKDPAVLSSFMIVFDVIARVGFLPIYENFIIKLISVMSTNPDLSAMAVGVLVTVSAQKEAAPILKKKGMDQYFQSLLQMPKYKSVAECFLQNLQK